MAVLRTVLPWLTPSCSPRGQNTPRAPHCVLIAHRQLPVGNKTLPGQRATGASYQSLMPLMTSLMCHSLGSHASFVHHNSTPVSDRVAHLQSSCVGKTPIEQGKSSIPFRGITKSQPKCHSWGKVSLNHNLIFLAIKAAPVEGNQLQPDLVAGAAMLQWPCQSATPSLLLFCQSERSHCFCSANQNTFMAFVCQSERFHGLCSANQNALIDFVLPISYCFCSGATSMKPEQAGDQDQRGRSVDQTHTVSTNRERRSRVATHEATLSSLASVSHNQRSLLSLQVPF